MASSIKTETPSTSARPTPQPRSSRFQPQNQHFQQQNQNFQQLPQVAPYRFKSPRQTANPTQHGNKSVIKRTADGQLVCEYCLKTFKSDAGLYYHKPIHTGQWKHTCDICDKHYMETSKYKAHMESHRKKFQNLHSYL